MPRHRSQQSAFPYPAAAENADTLSLAARQHTVDGANARHQPLFDVFTFQRPRRHGVKFISRFCVNRSAAIHRPSEPVENPAQKTWPYLHARFLPPRHNPVSQLQPVSLFEWHGKHAPISKTDHLYAYASARASSNFTKIANRDAPALSIR